MHILLTNDDGIYAQGLRALYRALLAAGHRVGVIAPLGEQSAVGHSVTMLSPLRVKQIEESDFRGMAVTGTPTDCVKLGLSRLLDEAPDLVVSGINAGANVGPDILYSGTVAAATEGAAAGFRSVAFSHHDAKHADINEYAAYGVELLARLPWKSIPKRRVVNINFPACPFAAKKGLALCPQTDSPWKDWFDERTDPRGRKYWWMNGEIPKEHVGAHTDKGLLDECWCTLTPLKFDFTDRECLDTLENALSGATLFR